MREKKNEMPKRASGIYRWAAHTGDSAGGQQRRHRTQRCLAANTRSQDDYSLPEEAGPAVPDFLAGTLRE